MTPTEIPTETPPEVLEVRPVRACDADALVRCIQRCYGDTYPAAAFYDRQLMHELIENGQHQGAVALADGVVVGHIGVRQPASGSSVVEAGTTIVDPGYRGQGVMGRLVAEVVRQLRERSITGLVHFPTTAHTIMQRASVVDGRETGVLLDYIPEATTDRAFGRTSPGRLAVTVVYQPISTAPAHMSIVPSRYRQAITAMAAGLRLRREWAHPGGITTASTAHARSTDPARSLERCLIDRIGTDIAGLVDALALSDQHLIHVDLPMTDPGIEHATEMLLAAGFVFGAWLPDWVHHDVLRLQRVSSPGPGTDRPNLFSEDAESIMRIIRVDARAGRRLRG
jgi:predicted N-acetyltransferase YhbS